MLRKGQKLCNYIQGRGTRVGDVHQMLFYMSDLEFEKVLES